MPDPAAPPLPAREAYRLWAPAYDAETAVSFLENRVVKELMGDAPVGSLIDVGCGRGRRMRESGASFAVGVDITAEMFDAAAPAERARLLVADLRALPVADGTFDVVWCRLVIGHVRDPAAALAELGRVCRPGGTVIVSDFHPAAVAAGHRRTFADLLGAVHEIEHHVHPPEVQVALAVSAGLFPAGRRDGVVGPAIRSFYAAAERLDVYEVQRGLPLVLALRFRRPPG
jgi:malonyl-CoA O-methyltransferase